MPPTTTSGATPAATATSVNSGTANTLSPQHTRLVSLQPNVNPASPDLHPPSSSQGSLIRPSLPLLIQGIRESSHWSYSKGRLYMPTTYWQTMKSRKWLSTQPPLVLFGMQIIGPPLVITAHPWFLDLDSPVQIRRYCRGLWLETTRAPAIDLSYLRVQDLRIMKSTKGFLHEYVVATVVAADRPPGSTDCVYLVFERYSTDRRGSNSATNTSHISFDRISPPDDATDASADAASEQSTSHTSNNIRPPTAMLGVPVAVEGIDDGHSPNSSLDSSSQSSGLAQKLLSLCILPLYGCFKASAESLHSSSKLVYPFQAGDYVRMLKKPSKCGGDTQVGLLKFHDPDSPLYFYELAFLALAVSEKQPNYSPIFHCYWFAGMIAFALEKLKDLKLPKSPQRGRTPFMNWDAMPMPKDTTVIQQLLDDYGKYVEGFVRESEEPGSRGRTVQVQSPII